MTDRSVGASLPGAAPQLKPCPFCGCEGTLVQIEGAWIAGCDAGQLRLDDDVTCRANAIGFYHVTPEGAVAAWNRRVDGGAALEAGPSPAGLTPIQELAQAAQNYLNAEAHVGVTHETLRELNHRLGSLAGPHLIAYEAIAPRNSGNAGDFGVQGSPQEKPSA